MYKALVCLDQEIIAPVLRLDPCMIGRRDLHYSGFSTYLSSLFPNSLQYTSRLSTNLFSAKQLIFWGFLITTRVKQQKKASRNHNSVWFIFHTFENWTIFLLLFTFKASPIFVNRANNYFRVLMIRILDAKKCLIILF